MHVSQRGTYMPAVSLRDGHRDGQGGAEAGRGGWLGGVGQVLKVLAVAAPACIR